MTMGFLETIKTRRKWYNICQVLKEENDREARRRIRRVKEAKFPRAKTLDEFDTTAIPGMQSTNTGGGGIV